jgi:predicted RNA binding protein with dsRBD fold (UPF0201 family)
VCRGTESLAKVKVAVLNLFPDAEFSREDDEVEAESASFDTLRAKVHAQKIRDSARGALLHGVEGGLLRFTLSKQAAYAGRASFAANSPLGDLEVEIDGGDPEAIVDAIAESTTRPPPPPLR